MISDQSDSKSAYWPRAFLDSRVLQRHVSLRDLSYGEQGPLQHPTRENRVETFALSLTLALQRFSPPTLC